MHLVSFFANLLFGFFLSQIILFSQSKGMQVFIKLRGLALGLVNIKNLPLVKITIISSSICYFIDNLFQGNCGTILLNSLGGFKRCEPSEDFIFNFGNLIFNFFAKTVQEKTIH